MDRQGVLERFKQLYGENGDIRMFFSPLRVNLIGEYTDIAGGYVLPCALDFGMFAAARKREDNIVRLAIIDSPVKFEGSIEEIQYSVADDWANYPKGVIYELVQMNKAIGGADIFYAASYAPLMSTDGSKRKTVASSGIGLSSSACLEVLTCVIFDKLFDVNLGGIQTALLSQRAENSFVGVKCGIMDQFAVAMGKEGQAIQINCATLDYNHFPLSFKDNYNEYALIVANTRKKRGLMDSKYNERREQCDAALNDLRNAGVIGRDESLCSVSTDKFFESRHFIKDKTCMRRARHVITENERVFEASKALADKSFYRFGKLLNQSHESLKYDFEVTGKELDVMQEAAVRFRCENGEVYGARMTGAGFGGCVIALADAACVPDFIASVGEQYTSQIGLEPEFYITKAGSGAMELK